VSASSDISNDTVSTATIANGSLDVNTQQSSTDAQPFDQIDREERKENMSRGSEESPPHHSETLNNNASSTAHASSFPPSLTEPTRSTSSNALVTTESPEHSSDLTTAPQIQQQQQQITSALAAVADDELEDLIDAIVRTSPNPGSSMKCQDCGKIQSVEEMLNSAMCGYCGSVYLEVVF
jgi:hypothetical protein